MASGKIRTVVAGLLVFGILAGGPVGCKDDGQKKQRYVTIGTGGVTGVYYPAGGVIAKFINRKKDVYGIRASVESTPASVYNINAVLTGDLDFGIAQSDRQYQAVHGLGEEWKDRGPQTKLRAVCSLHPEAVTLVAADDSGVKTLADLKGKKVNIGNPGSGNRGNAMDVLNAAGIAGEVQTEGLKAAESASMLQDGRIDAFFYTVGHPNGSIMEACAGQRRAVHFVPITGMDKLLAKHPYYARATIPIALYPKATNKADVATVGVMTTVVTSADVDEAIVYALTREVFENLDEFKTQHPAFAVLTKEGMLQGLSAPLHPGAVKYYKEAGLMK